MVKIMKTAKQEKVLKVAKELCKANNTVTTLEIKNELRRRYSTNKWNQSDISNLMSDFQKDGKFTFTDNGTFRIYSLPGSTVSPQLSATVKVSKTKVRPVVTTQRISKTKALEVIENSNGRFFTVSFTKKDGKNRVLNGQYTSDMGKSPLGYVLVRDITAVRRKDVKTIKNVNLQTLEWIKSGNTIYKVD